MLLFSVLGSLAQEPKITFITSQIVRVEWSPDGQTHDNNTTVCVYKQPMDGVITETQDAQSTTYDSGELQVSVDRKSGAVTFTDPNTGRTLLRENQLRPHEAEKVWQERVVYDDKTARMVETANGKITVRDVVRRDTTGQSTRFLVNFEGQHERAIYGLGSQMEDYMNLLGKTLYLTQHNLKVNMPVLSSLNGYGLLFDAGCAMKYVSTKGASGYDYSMQLEAAKELDYYFIKAPTMADVVAGYRYLTGQPSLMPRYFFGYVQSKERYKSSADIISTLQEYRRRHVPIDMIVQDWNYWPQGWGYMKMDPRYYPSPRALADSVHMLHGRLMVSIWPNPQRCPQATDFQNRGLMLQRDYDAFNPVARKLYWDYANKEFFSNGFDAWWCDSSEPLDADWKALPDTIDGHIYGWNDQERRWELNKQLLGETLGMERSQLYSLFHTRGIYENQRQTPSLSLDGTEKRVVNLTRSSFAGQQRYGTIVWNGDTHASWPSFRQQIPSGLNYMATGNPYWTVDVGSFFVTNDHKRWFYCGDFPDGVKDDAYKEYYVRMFQWATFLPMLRSHGTDTPREIWQFGNAGTSYYDAILKMINLRYGLVPYFYSMAFAQTLGNYSMTRMLAFDFPDDDQVLDIKDEMLTGDMLVCPVTHPMSETTTRRIYLPKGTEWIDFWTNERLQGGQWIDRQVTISRLPLFVKAGSIVPTKEPTEWTGAQKGKPFKLLVYTGKDAEFTLYDDEGDGYGYEHGQYAKTVLRWSEAKHTLEIGQRQGNYHGMPTKCTFIINVNGKTKTVSTNGEKRIVKFK